MGHLQKAIFASFCLNPFKRHLRCNCHNKEDNFMKFCLNLSFLILHTCAGNDNNLNKNIGTVKRVCIYLAFCGTFYPLISQRHSNKLKLSLTLVLIAITIISISIDHY